MTKSELLQRLRSEHIPERYYSLDGGMPPERWVLAKSKSGWEVYYSERGEKSGLKVFNSEHDACEHFCKELKDMLRYT